MSKPEPPPRVRFQIPNQRDEAPVGLDHVDELIERLRPVIADATLKSALIERISEAKTSGEVIDLSEVECNVLQAALEDVPSRSAFSPFSPLASRLRAEGEFILEQEPIDTGRPVGMDSPTAVQTSAVLHHGQVFAKTGTAALGLHASGRALQVAHQLVEVMSIAADDKLEVSVIMAEVKQRVPEARPLLEPIDTTGWTRSDILMLLNILVMVLLSVGDRALPPPTTPAPSPIVINEITINEITDNIHQTLIQMFPPGDMSGQPDPENRPAEHDQTP